MLKARLKFKAPWDAIVVEVAKQCKLSVDQYCERAVMLVMFVTKQGIEGGESNTTQQGLEGGKDGSRSQESGLADGQVSSNQDDTSATLADSEVPDTNQD